MQDHRPYSSNRGALAPRSPSVPRVVYRPESRMKHPMQLSRDMGRDLLNSRELAWQLLVRDLSAQYRQSLLGVAWSFIPPIVAAISLVAVKDANILNIGETSIPYAAYVMFSMALWQTFTEALVGPVQAVSAAKMMLVRIRFPHEALILAKLGEVFFNFGIKLVLIMALFFVFRIPITWNVLLAPVALLHLVLLGTAIGMFLAPIGALYQDVSKALTLAISFWLLLTPVIYPVPTQGAIAKLVLLNPVTPLLVTTRELATTGVITHPIEFWIASLGTIAGLLVSWLVYRLAMPFVVERISS